jgi:hypothetical protein
MKKVLKKENIDTSEIAPILKNKKSIKMKNEKYNKRVFILAITLLMNGMLFGQKAKKIVPKTENEKIVITGNKAFDYYALNEDKAVNVEMKGPGELIMYTRVLLNKDQKKSTDFIVKFAKDKKKPHVSIIDPLDIDPTAKSSEKAVTIENKMLISVPPGKHSYLFYKKGSTEAIYSHYAFRKGKKMNWNKANSKTNLENVVLTSLDKKKTSDYYRINEKQVFIGQANPGDYLKLVLRFECDKTDLKSVKTKIALSVDGKVVQKYTLFYKPTKKRVYKNEIGKVPGKPKEVVFLIPKMSSNKTIDYQIAVLDNNKNALVSMNTCSDYQSVAKKDHKVTALSDKKTLETTPEKESKKL